MAAVVFASPVVELKGVRVMVPFLNVTGLPFMAISNLFQLSKISTFMVNSKTQTSN